jgi:hypothetical protein
MFPPGPRCLKGECAVWRRAIAIACSRAHPSEWIHTCACTSLAPDVPTLLSPRCVFAAGAGAASRATNISRTPTQVASHAQSTSCASTVSRHDAFAARRSTPIDHVVAQAHKPVPGGYVSYVCAVARADGGGHDSTGVQWRIAQPARARVGQPPRPSLCADGGAQRVNRRYSERIATNHATRAGRAARALHYLGRAASAHRAHSERRAQPHHNPSS